VSKKPVSGRWVPGCKIEGNEVIAGTPLYATAKEARNHDSRSPCKAKPVRVRVSREDVYDHDRILAEHKADGGSCAD
jgi:hypothetical protein